MQEGVLVPVAALLAACGVIATTSNDAAVSATQNRQGKAEPRRSVGFQNYEEGGMAGCFDPSLAGYPRRAAERAGGVPCEQSPAQPAPTATSGAALTRAWLIGTWVAANAKCEASAPTVRFSNDGRFSGTTLAGDWRLARNQIVLTWRDVSEWEGEIVTSDMEAAAPLRTRNAPIARRPDDRLSFDGDLWQRCSNDPDFYLQ